MSVVHARGVDRLRAKRLRPSSRVARSDGWAHTGAAASVRRTRLERMLEVAARRIAWGRFSNAGQTCVAPDYVLVHEAVELELLAHLRAAVAAFYGDDPKTSPDFGRIVNDRNFERLSKLLRDGEVVCGGRPSQGTIHRPDHPRGVSPKRRSCGRRSRAHPAGAHRPEHGRGDRVRGGPTFALALRSRMTRRPSTRSSTGRARETPASTTSSCTWSFPSFPSEASVTAAWGATTASGASRRSRTGRGFSPGRPISTSRSATRPIPMAISRS